MRSIFRRKRMWIGALLAALVATGVAGVVALKRSRVAEDTQPSVEPAPERTRAKTALTFLEIAYDGRLGKGWQDWGWGPHELGNGAAKVRFDSYGGLLLFHEALSEPYGAVTFRFKAPADWPDFLSVSLLHSAASESDFPKVNISSRHQAPLPDGFREVLVNWTELNPSQKPFDRLMIAATRPVDSDWVLLDKIGFTKERAEGIDKPKPAAAERRVALEVRCDRPQRRINPLIYGVSMFSFDTGAPANRIGGNPLSRLNWDAGDLWNTGADWFFENHKQSKNLTTWLEDTLARGLKTALVVPTIGWVAKDGSSFGFPKSLFGNQRAHDPHRPEAGDGHRPDGTPLTPGPPTQTSIEAPPELIGQWVRKLAERDRARGKRSVDIYILDNEPALWNVTHRDVHPLPVGYDELLDRTVRYGGAIRAADPGGLIAGPAEWGWPAYFDSAKDRDAGGLLKRDRLMHGGVDLIPWYLRKLKEHEANTGVRVLDVLDLHYYPQANGIYGHNARTDPDAAALRIRSTRSLWDPTYKDESWIDDEVELIPRMKRWVEENYPGRMIALGEWSFGGDSHISGGLATLEALGRFGQTGLDAAFYWGELGKAYKTFWAFRAFRDFDGKGARFLDWSVPTEESEQVSLFASRDDAREKLVLIVANLDAKRAVRAELDVGRCGHTTSARDFAFGADSTEIEPSSPWSPPGDPTRITQGLPPLSFKIVELKMQTSASRP